MLKHTLLLTYILRLLTMPLVLTMLLLLTMMLLLFIIRSLKNDRTLLLITRTPYHGFSPTVAGRTPLKKRLAGPARPRRDLL
jgi:hypothetical protein